MTENTSNEPILSPTKLLDIELWDVDRPKDYPLNARKWSGEAIDKVAASLKAYGFRQPLVVDTEEVICIGHLRRAAARAAGIKQIPVHVARDLTAAQIRGLRLADNRTHDESDWDLEILCREFSELKLLDFDLASTGFDMRELDGLTLSPNAAEDEVPPVPIAPVSRLGDLWVCGRHRVLCGDCTDAAAVARLLDGRQPGLMVTDPPYGISLDSEWRDRAGLNTAPGHKRTAASKAAAKANPQYPAEPSYPGDTRADWSEAFELVPSLVVGYVWHASRFTREVLDGLLRIGFLYPQQIIWNKLSTVLTRTHYWYQHEPCWYVRKVNAPWYGKAGENSTVWDCASPKFIMGASKDPADVKQDHPTQKPVELMRRSILNHTQPTELVYEPFLGSGTTLAAAELTGRACLGMEIDPKYVDVVVKRWQALSGCEPVLGDGHYKGATFEHVREGRMREAEDALMEEALHAAK